MPAPSKKSYPWQRKRRKLLWLLAVPTLLLLAFFIHRGHLRAQLNERIAELRGAGLPVSGEELREWKGPMPDRAAGELFVQAQQQFVAPDAEQRQHLPFLGPVAVERDSSLSEEVLTEMRAVLNANAEALRLLHEAAAGEDPFYRSGTADELINLLRLEAVQAAQRRDAARGVRAISALQALAYSRANEPVLSSLLGTLRMEESAHRLAELLLNRMPLDGAQLQQLEEAFAPRDERALLRRALAGERASIMDYFVAGDRASGQGAPIVLDAASQVLGFHDRMALRVLDHFEYLMAHADWRTADGPLPQAAQPRRGRVYLHIRSVLLSLDDILVQIERVEAMRAALHAALAIERFRLTEERLPASLEELVPTYLNALPRDPMAPEEDAPLIYRQLSPAGYTVYSVGSNGEDNEGSVDPVQTGERRRFGEALDYGLRVLR